MDAKAAGLARGAIKTAETAERDANSALEQAQLKRTALRADSAAA